MCIRDYLRGLDEGHRNVCLVPASAHGTNPASAAMAGMKVVVVKNTAAGDVDLKDLRAKVDKHALNLAALMVRGWLRMGGCCVHVCGVTLLPVAAVLLRHRSPTRLRTVCSRSTSLRRSIWCTRLVARSTWTEPT